MNASFEEKSAWIQLASLVVVLGGYFVTAWQMMSAGITAIGAFVPLFISATVFLVIVLVVAHVVAALTGRADDADERDRLIECRAETRTSWILGAGVFTAVCGMAASYDNVWIAHLLIGSLLAAEVAKLALQVTYYRRGI